MLNRKNSLQTIHKISRLFLAGVISISVLALVTTPVINAKSHHRHIRHSRTYRHHVRRHYHRHYRRRKIHHRYGRTYYKLGGHIYHSKRAMKHSRLYRRYLKRVRAIKRYNRKVRLENHKTHRREVRLIRKYNHYRRLYLHRNHYESAYTKSKRPIISHSYNNNYAKIFRNQLLKDVNRDRRQHGRHSLKINWSLQHIANQRNYDVYKAYHHYNDYKRYPINQYGNPADRWIHGIDTKQDAEDFAKKDHLSIKTWGENAGDEVPYAKTFYVSTRRHNYNVPNDFRSAYKTAKYLNNRMMYHDNTHGNHNGHRRNILYSKYRSLGIATHYNARNNMVTVVEDFSTK